MITEQGWARIRGVLRRRRLPIAAVTAITLAAAVLLIGRLQPRYRASAVVRALESQPAREYVPPPAVEQLGERLRTLRVSLMARPLLAKVAEDLGRNDKGKGPAHGMSPERLVEDMRSRLEVKVEGEDTFLITYDDADPVRAQAVVNALARHFIEEQVVRRQAVARGTYEALAAEEKRLGPEVQALESRIRDFKFAHYGSLPEQQEQNLRLLDQTTLEINIQSTNLDYQNDRRRQLIIAAIAPLRHQEEQLNTALHAARTQYLPDHPEVKRILAEYEQTRATRLAEEQRLRHQMRTGSPELIALDSEIGHTQSLLDGLRQRQADVRRRVAETAQNGQLLARMQADHDAARAKLDTVRSRLRDAELALGLEKELAGLRYELVEGALLPMAPVFPNRPTLALGGIVLALALGLGLGFLLDRADSRIYAPAEMLALGRPIPLLACIPEFEADTKQRSA
jgi:succinoglycan biosynthesis transport protein ExoP